MANASDGDSYLPIDEAAMLGHEEKFFHNVRNKVIPRLIAAGKLRGKSDGGVDQVFADADFDRLMRCGIEPFVYNMQGWSRRHRW